MTVDNKRKKRIRAFAAEMGVNYTTAMRLLAAERPPAPRPAASVEPLQSGGPIEIVWREPV